MEKADLTKHFIPVSVAVAVFWVLSQLSYGAGGKVAGSEKDVASLAARVDGIAKAQDKADGSARLDHDLLTKLQTQLDGLKNQAPIRLDVTGAK